MPWNRWNLWRAGVATMAWAMMLAVTVNAQATHEDVWKPDNGRLTGLSITHDNDLIYEIGTRRQNYDRNYSFAVAATVFGDWVYHTRLDRPLRWIDAHIGVTPLRNPHRLWFYSGSVLMSGFTPDSLNTASPLPGDRPYASLVGVSVRRLSVEERSHRSAWTSELVVGILGLSFGPRAQSYVHHVLRDPPEKPEPYLPEGWSNQISNGGELTALYRVAYDRFLWGHTPTPGSDKHWQASWGATGTIGYYTTAAVNVGARLGWFRSEFWEHLPGALSMANQNLGPLGHRGRHWELFLHANIRPRLTLYNALLQGQFRESRVTVGSRDIDRLQGEVDVAAVLFAPICNGGVQLSWSPLIMRTRDARVVNYSTHRWGSATIGVSIGLDSK